MTENGSLPFSLTGGRIMPIATSIRQPSYRKHKPSGQAVVTLGGKDIYLGRYGTEASRVKYDRIVAEWLANGRRLPTSVALSIVEVIKPFWAWVEMHYRKLDGTQTSEVAEYRYSLRPINHLFGTTSAAEFGPLKFKAVRQLMIDGYEHPKYGHQKPLCRGVINHRMERIKRMFRWATENELVPPSIYHGLLAVRGLQHGRTKARETEPVRPVPEARINAIRPFVSAPVEAIIDLQLLTGARPGEICTMRACDLDTSRRIWIYIPESHKTQHHGHRREIYLGPHAQEIVKPFLKTSLQAYLFSPQDAEAERLRVMREKRKTKVQPSQFNRKKKKPKKLPGDHYDVAAYRRAVAYACLRAFPLPHDLAPRIKPDGKRETAKVWQARLTSEEKTAIRAWKREHSWHPHQLRHNAATNLRKEFGVEVARIILGHATAFTTEIYAEADRRQAMEVIGKIG
jgi:integrase